MLTLPDLLNILYCLRHYLCLGSDGSDRTVRTDRTVKEWLIITSSLSGVLTPMALKGLCVWLCESSSVTICGVSAPMALTGRVGLCCRERVSARHYLCSLLLRQCPLSVRAGPTHRIETQILTQYWNNWALHWWLCGNWYMICNM